MKRIALVALLAAGCAHVDSSSATFVRQVNARLVLKIERHVDTIAHGPDIEEDQRLILELSDLTLNQRIPIPSERARARFNVERFGLGSQGQTFKGFVILRSIKKDAVVAYLKLDVTANTKDGSYVQTAKYHSDYTFVRE